MLKIFAPLKEKTRLVRKEKEGTIISSSSLTMSTLFHIYQKYYMKSIREGVYYLKGSTYFMDLLIEYDDPSVFESFFMPNFDKIDDHKPDIPIEIGRILEDLVGNPGFMLGMHRSGMIKGDPYDSPILHSMVTDGLINNGAAMQGLYTKDVCLDQTVKNTNDMITACSTLKSSFRGSRGAVLVRLPKEIVDNQMRIKEGYEDEIYNIDENGIHYIKPEYIIGYISVDQDGMSFYSREDLIKNYKRKER